MAGGINLEDLAAKAPGMSQGTVEHYQHSCIVCLDDHGHVSGSYLDVTFQQEQVYVPIRWQASVTDDMRRWFRDQRKSVDLGACAIALLIIPEFASLVAVQQSATGDGVDYYLSDPNSDDDLLFNNAAHLEISGIHTETAANSVDRRIAAKRKRLDHTRANSTSPTKDLPTYICIVEFSRPKTKVVLA